MLGASSIEIATVGALFSVMVNFGVAMYYYGRLTKSVEGLAAAMLQQKADLDMDIVDLRESRKMQWGRFDEQRDRLGQVAQELAVHIATPVTRAHSQH
jgi:hypothetical protein